MITKWNMVVNLANNFQYNYPQWRKGQSLFNALYILDPETADVIRGTKDDCFYQDDKITAFCTRTIELWHEEN